MSSPIAITISGFHPNDIQAALANTPFATDTDFERIIGMNMRYYMMMSRIGPHATTTNIVQSIEFKGTQVVITVVPPPPTRTAAE